MRQADIHRVERAAEHIKAAMTQLNGIKEKRVTGAEFVIALELYGVLNEALKKFNSTIKDFTAAIEPQHTEERQ